MTPTHCSQCYTAAHLALWPQSAAAAAAVAAASACDAARQACGHDQKVKFRLIEHKEIWITNNAALFGDIPAAAALCNADRCKDPGSAAAGWRGCLAILLLVQCCLNCIPGLQPRAGPLQAISVCWPHQNGNGRLRSAPLVSNRKNVESLHEWVWQPDHGHGVQSRRLLMSMTRAETQPEPRANTVLPVPAPSSAYKFLMRQRMGDIRLSTAAYMPTAAAMCR
jgi:hypothetical protein